MYIASLDLFSKVSVRLLVIMTQTQILSSFDSKQNYRSACFCETEFIFCAFAYMAYIVDCLGQSQILILCPGNPENVKLTRKLKKKLTAFFKTN